ncbi:zinc ABC transporter substrate-binding protein [Devosia faecipullorum]|uniref:zinc ABC transporter substrate-binding protein n=1 Tax=Devosia faecipullorum TaxID=2755039 RepID=UPI00187B9B3B|nr:zinc ABC transporter substrate-binding protein [Devosia faecipullorum]MBE7733909.1 zinc ABC transporter substrate-binding protein [Devosia faecipullorum]
MPKFVLSLAALLPILFSGTALAAPDAVASTKPIHSLVSAVMGDLGTPRLIVRGAASPHTYSLRPSDAAALENADIVFWTGHGLELFLAKALDSLALKAEVVELAKAPGIVLLPLRQGGAFEAHAHDEADHDHEGHDHDHDHDGHDHDSHGDGDMHFWLDPENAGLMVSHIADILAAADPDNADAYRANAEAELQRLDALTAELQVKLAPVAGKPFIVFHDAYQYFEARFGLELAGAVTISPDVMPGAARIDQLRDRVDELGATCVFAEPNFEPAIIRTIVEGTKASSGVLDPEGSALTEGPDLYPQLLRGLADGLVDCLVRD